MFEEVESRNLNVAAALSPVTTYDKAVDRGEGKSRKLGAALPGAEVGGVKHVNEVRQIVLDEVRHFFEGVVSLGRLIWVST